MLGRRPVLMAAAVLFVVHALLHGLGQTLPVLALGSVVGGSARALDSGPLQAWFVDTIHGVDAEADLKPGLARGMAIGAAALGAGALAGGALVSLAPLPTRGAAVVSLSVPFWSARRFRWCPRSRSHAGCVSRPVSADSGSALSSCGCRSPCGSVYDSPPDPELSAG